MDTLERFLNKRWFPVSIYILVTFILYGATLAFELTYLDDNVWLKDYRWYLKDIKRIFSVFRENDVLFGELFYRPMIYVSFILDTQWGKEGYFSYHWTNIWIHILNTLLVFSLLQKFDFKRAIAFCGGLLFCVHPICVSAVAWIPGRTDSLFALFLFTSFYYFMVWVEGRRKRSLAVHLVFWFCALLTKETAVVAPVLFGFYILLQDNARQKIKQHGFTLIFWIGLLAGYFVLRQGGINPKYNKDVMLMISSLIENLPALLPYLGKTLLPFNVSVLPVTADLTHLYGILTVGIIAVGCFYTKNKRNKIILFGVAWFFLFILPSLVFSFLKHEYRLYVPMFGFLLVMLEILRGQKRQLEILAVIVILFGGISFWHVGHYHDRFAFWENAVKTSPHSPLAHRNLGAMYFLNKQPDLAEKEFLIALELNPEEAMCYNNLGLIYESQKKYVEAEEAYFKEIEINPYYDVVHYNLGLFYYKLGIGSNAEMLWKRTLRLNPRYLAAYHHLIAYHLNKKNMKEARFYAGELQKQGGKVEKKIFEQLNNF